ncbi:MAG: glutamate ABC transporter substrate-binding protein, partial [Acidimicrobiia bacterium]
STVSSLPAFEAGTTMAAIQQKGKIVVGTKFDQRGFGLKNAVGGQVEGFDVEIAKLLVEGIFGEGADVSSKIEFVEALSKNREPFIEAGTVDLVVATYSITDARKQKVAFAGPYFVAGQDIIVRTEEEKIGGVEDLNGRKVCSVQGSTSLATVKEKAPRADLSITFDQYSKCAEALSAKRVDAVTTDDTILAGIVKDSEGAFKLVGKPFTREPYGIGLKRGDDSFRDFLNERLEAIYEGGQWTAAFEATLGEIGIATPQPPAVDRYIADSGEPAQETTPTTS